MLDALRYVQFTPIGTPDDPRSRCQRYAVLAPLCGPVTRGAVAHAVVGDDGLVRRWRRALSLYRDPDVVAWDPESTWPRRLESRLNCLVNCRPTFVRVKGAWAKACSAYTLCPFCWGRRAGDVYDRLEYAFFDDPALGPVRRPLRKRRPKAAAVDFSAPFCPYADPDPDPASTRRDASPLDLVTRTARVPSKHARFTLGEGNARGLDAEERSLPRLIRARIEGRPKAGYGRAIDFARARGCGLLGGFERLRVTLAPSGRRWEVQIRQVFAAPAGWEPDAATRLWLDAPSMGFRDPDGGPPRARWEIVRNPGRQAVAVAAGYACAYEPLLLRGPLQRAAELLTAREGSRVSAMSGVFRNGAALG